MIEGRTVKPKANNQAKSTPRGPKDFNKFIGGNGRLFLDDDGTAHFLAEHLWLAKAIQKKMARKAQNTV